MNVSANLTPNATPYPVEHDCVLQTVFTTAGQPSPERLASFDRFLACTRRGARVLSRRPELFSARVRAARLGPVEVSELTVDHATVARTPALVRAADPDAYSFVTPLSGRMRLTQAGRDTELEPGWMALRASSRPFELHVSAGHGPARLIRAQVPRSLLAQPRHSLDRLLAEPISSRSGIGRLFAQFLRSLASESCGEPSDRPSDYLMGDLSRLGNLTVDMFDALLAHALDRDLEVAPPRQVLLAGVTGYIREHLRDPGLSPKTVAAAHHISVSYLHRLFEGRELTVAASIREQRLDRARRDLADPRLVALPIHRIAARWGFRDHATFTRAFRTRFGLPPRAVREDHRPSAAR